MRLLPEFTSSQRRWLVAIALVAFSLRMVSGLLKGPDFVDSGYGFYADIAQTLWSGEGFCHEPNQECAVRMPVYPALIAPFVSTGIAYPWLIVFKAMIGTATVIAAALLATLLFNRRVGLLAAAAAALNPYAVVHGPSLQDTVAINFLCALSVLLLVLSSRKYAVPLGAAAGVALGLTVLTSARMLPFAVAAALWVITDRWKDRRAALAAIAPLVLLVGLWCARNAYVVGSPVLTTEAGESLWLAHHERMLEIYPGRSIDQVAEVAWSSLDAGTQARLTALSSDPVRLDRVYAGLAVTAFRERPIQLTLAAMQKVLVSLGGWLSPARSWPVQLGYAALYVPLNLLALIGLWKWRRAGSAHTLVLLIFAGLVLTTAVFWSHTSHRSYVHIFKIMYAAAVAEPWLRRYIVSRVTPSPELDGVAFQSAAS